jgi:two-component system alkaline phosphatase synthesis response regulator PhoP
MSRVNPTVLIIDDEKDLIEMARHSLEKHAFDVIGALDGESGLDIAKNQAPDIVLLDLMLPGVDGLEVCRRLRNDAKTARIPILMLTAKAEETDRIVGLEIGADDYITKPFSPREVVARVKAVLRRAAPQPESREVLKHGNLQIDTARHEVTCAGEKITLTATEFRILHHLVSQPGRVFSRNDIIDGALGRDTAVLDRTIDVHVTAIRRKMGDCGKYLETLRGVGYRFEAPRSSGKK